MAAGRAGGVDCPTIRKVKCDETRPACNRCVSTGRTCDGEIGAASLPVSSRGRPLLPATSTGSSSSLSGKTVPFWQSISHDLTDRERYGFEHFQNVTAPALQAILPSPEWVSTALQLSVREPTVFLAITATGTMARALTVLMHSSFPRPLIQEPALEATRQYGKALRLLRYRLNTAASMEGGAESTLLVCLLFVCFETFRSQNSAAAQHAHLGWNLAKSCSSYTQGMYSPSARFFDSVFSQSNGMSAFFVDKQHHDLDCCSDWRDLSSTSFKSWKEAVINLNALATAGDHLRAEFFQLAKARTSFTLDSRVSTNGFCFCLTACLSRTIAISGMQATRLQQLQIAHRRWKEAFVEHEDKLKRRDLRTFLLLRTKHLYSSFTLATCRDSNELPTDHFTNDFADALDMAERYVKEEGKPISATGQETQTQIRFFGSSILPTLDLIAHKCRDPQLRYRAIHLLSKIQKQEGLEDSQALSKYAQAAAEVEEGRAQSILGLEEKLLPSTLPEEARFSDVVTVGEGARQIFRLICARYVDAESASQEIEVVEYEAGSVPLRLCSSQRVLV
ncbi:hypothetical protein M409DRAFT_48888 [Zasmidium cellare ATCC 36951]|uniref:Zn(2)-C6 fungal-type domain-containing protein n=1 Tax=Zasmidium cellare ATCC 36951 TaxID=1080233 RepID=A0A6A6D743_ZASCE|nr:uncharacterized protein M409DRAFT_48888 [Zasmidium cellare ATCC 36951]KAF2173989.1 hypothetical protein M409DRAFT_48888 [Zasmidium cellare ATCC 36951]